MFNWLYKIASLVSVDTEGYESEVLQYFQDIADRHASRQQELEGYAPNFDILRQDLIDVGYTDPDSALNILKSDGFWDQETYRQLMSLYRSISNIYYELPPEDPKRYQVERLKDNIRKIQDVKEQWSFTHQEANEEASRVIAQSKVRLNKIAGLISNAIKNIPEWQGSEIKISPIVSSDAVLSQRDYGSAISSAEVSVGGATSWGSSVSFTLLCDWEEENIAKIEIDDVLEGGDSDFFEDNKTQIDYFNLINSIRNPNRKNTEKILTLYTARPAKDRQLYLDSDRIPTNIFLTNSYENAFGLSLEYSERDIWKVRIRSKYLIQTLDSPRDKWYQAVSSGETIPVESITLISPWENNE